MQEQALVSSNTTVRSESSNYAQSIEVVRMNVEPRDAEVRHKNELLAEKERIIQELRQQESSNISSFMQESQRMIQAQAEKLTAAANVIRDKDSQLEEVSRSAQMVEAKLNQLSAQSMDTDLINKQLRNETVLAKRELSEQTAVINRLEAGMAQLQLENKELVIENEHTHMDITRLRRELEAQRSLEMSLRLEASNLTTHVTGKTRLVDELRQRAEVNEKATQDFVHQLRGEHECTQQELREQYAKREIELSETYSARVREMIEQHKRQVEELERKHSFEQQQGAERAASYKAWENTVHEEMTQRDEAWKMKLHNLEVEIDRAWGQRLDETEGRHKDDLERVQSQMAHREQNWLEKYERLEKERMQESSRQVEEAMARAKEAEDQLNSAQWELEEEQTRVQRLVDENSRLRWEHDQAVARSKTLDQDVKNLHWQIDEQKRQMESDMKRVEWRLEEESAKQKRTEDEYQLITTEYQDRISNLEQVVGANTQVYQVLRVVEEEYTRRVALILQELDTATELKLTALATTHAYVVNQYRERLKEAREDQKLQRMYPYLGVEVCEEVPTTVKGYQFSGVKLTSIKEGGPANLAGMVLADAVRYVEVIHRAEIRDLMDFRRAIEKVRPNDVIAFTLERAQQYIVKELVVQGSDADQHKPPTRRKAATSQKAVAGGSPMSPQSSANIGDARGGHAAVSPSQRGEMVRETTNTKQPQQQIQQQMQQQPASPSYHPRSPSTGPTRSTTPPAGRLRSASPPAARCSPAERGRARSPSPGINGIHPLAPPQQLSPHGPSPTTPKAVHIPASPSSHRQQGAPASPVPSVTTMAGGGNMSPTPTASLCHSPSHGCATPPPQQQQHYNSSDTQAKHLQYTSHQSILSSPSSACPSPVASNCNSPSPPPYNQSLMRQMHLKDFNLPLTNLLSQASPSAQRAHSPAVSTCTTGMESHFMYEAQSEASTIMRTHACTPDPVQH